MIRFPDEEREKSSPYFLKPDECQFIIDRLEQDRGDVEIEEFNLVKYLQPALHLEVWGFAFIFLSVVSNDKDDCCSWQLCRTGLTSFPVARRPSRTHSHVSTFTRGATEYIKLTRTDFLPIILRENLNFSLAASQCLIAPPYAFSAILMYATSWVGDRYRVRGIIVVGNSLLGVIGLCVMGFHADSAVKYFGVFLAVGGVNANIPAIMTYQVKSNQAWTGVNFR